MIWEGVKGSRNVGRGSFEVGIGREGWGKITRHPRKRGDGSLRFAVMGGQAREWSEPNSVVPMVGKNT